MISIIIKVRIYMQVKTAKYAHKICTKNAKYAQKYAVKNEKIGYKTYI